MVSHKDGILVDNVQQPMKASANNSGYSVSLEQSAENQWTL
jgi:hypothetical protein